MRKILLATRNQHKAREILEIMKGPFSILSLSSFPAIVETVEDQPTLEGNAVKKAREAAQASNLWALADDTGLEVSALGGAPGVLSARYAGENRSFLDNIQKLLSELAQTPWDKRRAVFRTVVALSSPEGETQTVEGRLEGMILEKPRGLSGFGYDPVFFVPALNKTLAEISLEEKNSISHRALAFKKIKSRLLEIQ